MSVVSAPGSSSYRSHFKSRHGSYRPPPVSGAHNFSRMRVDQDCANLIPYSKSYEKSNYNRDWDGNDNSTVVSACTTASALSYTHLVSAQQRLDRDRRVIGNKQPTAKDDSSGICCCFPFSALCRLNYAGLISLITVFVVPAMLASPFVKAAITGHPWPSLTFGPTEHRFFFVILVCYVIQVFAVQQVHTRLTRPRLPRIIVSRVAFTLSLVFVLIGFGLFFVINDLPNQEENYTETLLTTLLLLVTTIVIHIFWHSFEANQPQASLTVFVTRDPDGECHPLVVNCVTVQEAAVVVLNRYKSDFAAFNAFFYRTMKEGTGSGFKFNPSVGLNPGFKVYSIDECEGPDGELSANDGVISVQNAKSIMQAASRRGRKYRSENFHNKLEFEKKIAKRRSELSYATEEAFAHAAAINANNAKFNTKPMDSTETAKIILGVIASPLRKYLKLTQQSGFFHLTHVEQHLRYCLAMGFTSDVFLEPFFSHNQPVVDDDSSTHPKWSLHADFHPGKQLAHGQVFELRCLDPSGTDFNVRLVCRVDTNGAFDIVQGRRANMSYTYQAGQSHGQTSRQLSPV